MITKVEVVAYAGYPITATFYRATKTTTRRRIYAVCSADYARLARVPLYSMSTRAVMKRGTRITTYEIGGSHG